MVGEIVELAQRYRDEGADELVFYDITASPDGRSVDRECVSRVAAVIDIPFCVAGGIRSIADAEEVLNKGADKISINTPALEDPELITRLARRFGTQCVVRIVRAVCTVPLIASGGAGAIEHFRDVFRVADVDGALAASVFHSAEIDIRDLKAWLQSEGIAVRPAGDLNEH